MRCIHERSLDSTSAFVLVVYGIVCHLVHVYQVHTMSFSDNDLKRLKERIEHADAPPKSNGVGLTTVQLEALLARLEAAERYADRFEPIDDEDIELLQAWRSAAGK
jgi:hypothetical protein